jgi:GT2 family glycosyltransferase
MSVNSPAAAHQAVQPPEFPRHVVTAVLVAHDGARWLPAALTGLLAQDRPPQAVIAADTGSADDSARLLADALGPDRVLHLARRTGFGAAVAEAARAAGPVPVDELPWLRPRTTGGWDPVAHAWVDEADAFDEPADAEPVQWLWLLHDDCEPRPDALAELLRVADASPSAAIVGPKLRSWYDRRQLLETGVSIARSGRRWTGLERREQDQGQHDQVRQVLSVSSAGMLVRRDVWEALGGFDRRLPLMRDDVDFCWRAQAAGHTVLVAPGAVLRHAEAASRERRPVDCAGRGVANPHRVDKAGAVYTLLANTRGPLLPYVFLRVLIGTVLRTLAYLVGKVPVQAVDEVTGLLAVLLRPERLLAARRARGRGAVPPGELRPLFPPFGATVRATVEQVAANISGRASADTSNAGRHGGGGLESGPGDEDGDFLEVEQFALLKRLARNPGPVLFAVLLVVSLAACRSLLGGGSLAGGALLPAPARAHQLWDTYLSGWHALGAGGTPTAPPYLAVTAAVSTVLFGSTGLTLAVLLVASVPLAGVCAYFASRPLVESRLLRAWGSVAYAFLPAATGALAGGRLGTALLAVLLPLLARTGAGATGLRLTDDAVARGTRPGWRSAWAFALLLTVTTAFTPITWPLALVLCGAALALRVVRGPRPLVVPLVLRSLAMLGAPLVVLAPWSLGLLTHPGRFLREAGLPYGTGAASTSGLLLFSPGGPKGGGGILLAGILLAALGALLRGDRRRAVLTAWACALAGLLFAGVENAHAWAGPATLVYGLGLLAAAAVGAENAREALAARGFGWRQPAAALVALAAAIAPLYAAFGWIIRGADGPLERRDPTQVPAFVAEESGTRDQPRTLVLTGTANHVSYALVRGSGARLGDADLAAEQGPDTKLDSVVANLVAGSGADQGDRLGGYAVQYVLVKQGAPRAMSRVLDATPGLSRVSQADGSALWRVSREVSRITITPPAGKSGSTVPVAAGQIGARTTIPAGADGRVLRIADTAAPGWHATLDGRPLTPTTVDGWAQGFTLPAAGGRLALSYQETFGHKLWLALQGFLAVVLVVMALPGRRREVDDDLPEEVPVAEADLAEAGGEGRRARRLRAAAEASEAAAGADPASGADAAPGGDAVGAAPGAVPPARTAPDAEPEYAPVPAAPPTDYAAQPGEYDPYAAPHGTGTWATYPEDGYGYQQQQPDPYAQSGDYPPDPGYEAEPGYEAQPGYAGQSGYQTPGYPAHSAEPPVYDPYGYGEQPGYDPYGQNGYPPPAYDPNSDPAAAPDGYRHDGSEHQ